MAPYLKPDKILLHHVRNISPTHLSSFRNTWDVLDQASANADDMTAEREGLTAIETIAPPDHMPQLTDAERQTGSGRAEQTAGKGVTPPGMTAVTDTDTVLTDAAGKTDIAGKIGMQIRIGTEAETGTCLAADMVKTAGSRHETGIGMCWSGFARSSSAQHVILYSMSS